MTEVPPAAAGGGSIVDRLARLSTGIKMFVVLSLALLPLGMIILFAALQTTRTADFERRSMLRVALNESARRLASELATDITTLRVAANDFEEGTVEARVCNQTASILSTTAGQPTPFAIFRRGGRSICQSAGFAPDVAILGDPPAASATIDPQGRQLRVVIPSADRAYWAIAVYGEEQLARIGRPSGFLPPYDLKMVRGDREIMLVDDYRDRPFTRNETMTGRINPIGMRLEMSVQSAPFTASEVLTMLLPLLMWAAAATVGWLVVDRLLIRPLIQLRSVVAGYRPGEVLEPLRRMTTPSKEIRELGDTFRAITQTVANHEADLAAGLNRQTRLTREVHHRVKNNLQVIASLISLHARAAKSPEAGAAYASIQRRVDALAVVHRNHFAELEENRGVGLRSLISELGSNLRATAPPEAARLGLTFEVPSLYVTQDVAVPIAFMVTELIELAMLCDPTTAIHIGVGPGEADGRCRLTIRSPALIDSKALRQRLDEGFERVLEGLARQLRAQLERDGETGAFSVAISVVRAE